MWDAGNSLTWKAAVILLAACPTPASRAAESYRIREDYAPGYQYHVSCRVDLSGTLKIPGAMPGEAVKELTIRGDSAIEYDERVLSAAEGKVDRVARIYRRIDFARSVDGRPQKSTIRPSVRRLVLLRHDTSEVPFSQDGPLMWGEIDLVRTDVFTPALQGLLPQEAAALGSTWQAATLAVRELTDLERIEEGGLVCNLEQITTLEGRRYARIGFSGVVRGVNEDGPNRQKLAGYLFFDLASGHISYLFLQGTSTLLDPDGRELGKVEGRFVLTRQAHVSCPDLADHVIRNLATEPTPENTRLLYENAELGVRFAHSRRWRVSGVRGGQITLDDSAGRNGLLLTLDDLERTPTAASFLEESRAYLGQQQARILSTEPPRRVTAALGSLERFRIVADISGQRTHLEYFVLRQPRGGATLAGRFLPTDLEALQREALELAQSVARYEPVRGR